MGISGYLILLKVVRCYKKSLVYEIMQETLLASFPCRPSHRPVFGRLQIITNWTVGRPGNEANFLPLVSCRNLLIDSECGKKESKHFIALVEGDWVSLCAIVCPHYITQVVFKVVRANESKCRQKCELD